MSSWQTWQAGKWRNLVHARTHAREENEEKDGWLSQSSWELINYEFWNTARISDSNTIHVARARFVLWHKRNMLIASQVYLRWAKIFWHSLFFPRKFSLLQNMSPSWNFRSCCTSWVHESMIVTWQTCHSEKGRTWDILRWEHCYVI